MNLANRCLLILFFFVNALSAQDQSLAPYFQVSSNNVKEGGFSLLETNAEVNISGLIAEVIIEQVYHNPGNSPIEAVYVFPGSTKAAVNGLEMKIGERMVKAQIQEKSKARELYQKAKQAGKRTSLLEQDRPNIFTMNVANIMPGDTIRTILRYTELLVPEEGIYEFVYPTVVGPRYTGEAVPAMLASVKVPKGIPYTLSGEKPKYTFSFDLTLNGGMPLQKVSSPSHKIQTEWNGTAGVNISLDPTEIRGGNRDFILRYSLRGKNIESGFLMHEGEEENNFLLMVQPPERIRVKEITPREYIFIVDVSGSMNGFPLNISKKLMNDLLSSLRPTDRFNVLAFAGSAGFLAAESLEVTPTNIEKAITNIKNLQGGGGTRMLNALQKAMAVPKKDGFSRSFIILTDGYVSVEAEAFEYVRNNLGNANFFTFGIGSSVNRHLLEGMARAGKGEPFVVTQEEEGAAVVDKLRKYIESPLLTDIQIQFEGLEAYDVLPSNYPDLMGERPLIVFGKYKKEAKGKILIKGKSARGDFQKNILVQKYHTARKEKALRYLWARNKIQELEDQVKSFRGGADKIDEITQLGLKYQLLTNYTSFLAVDETIVNSGGKGETQKRTLPLPQGVPNTAVGETVLKDEIIIEEVTPRYFEQSVQSRSNNHTIAMPRSSIPPPPPPPVPTVEEIFSVTEEMPRFPGCEELTDKNGRKNCAKNKMLEFVFNNLKWPAAEQSNSSMTVVQFTVEKDGRLSNIKIVRSLSGEVDREVIRVIKLMPRWIPGRQRGRAVPVIYNLPIRVHLE